MTRRFTKSSDVVERKVRDSLILVPLKTGSTRLDALYTLNDTAGFIWHHIDQDVEEGELVASMAAEYQVDLATAQEDVRRIMDGLVAVGAVVLTEQDA